MESFSSIWSNVSSSITIIEYSCVHLSSIYFPFLDFGFRIFSKYFPLELIENCLHMGHSTEKRFVFCFQFTFVHQSRMIFDSVSNGDFFHLSKQKILKLFSSLMNNDQRPSKFNVIIWIVCPCLSNEYGVRFEFPN